jgi:hypothetical protein
MPETWYVLEDDSVADPQHVLADKDGTHCGMRPAPPSKCAARACR